MSQVNNYNLYFLDLLNGKERLRDLPELPKLKSVSEWDGKDSNDVSSEKEADLEDL